MTEVFGLARPELDVALWYSLTLCTEHPGALPVTTGHFSCVVEHGLEAPADADTIIVPGWNGEPSPAVLEAMRSSDARLVSICSGVFLLAATGRLDGREVPVARNRPSPRTTKAPR